MKHILISMTLVHLCGCAAVDVWKSKERESVKATADNPVTKIVCLWQPAEGRGLDNLPSRGFAGQIIFLTAQSATPVEVDGNVTIYQFDDQGPAERRVRPIHLSRFVDGSWQTHLIPTAWGPTYQVFVPYVRKGNHRAACSLAVRLDAKTGQSTNSDLADIVLSGSGHSPADVAVPVSRSHRSFPAGQVHSLHPAAVQQSPQVMPASLIESGNRHSETDLQTRHTQGFESFTIPYDAGRMSDNRTIFPQNR